MADSPKTLQRYAATVASIGSILLVFILARGFPDQATLLSPKFLLLAGGVIVGEFVRITVPHRHEAVTVTVGDPFTLSVLFTFGLAPAVLVKTLATLMDDLYRRAEWWKSLFNIAQFTLSLGFCYLIVQGLGYSIGAPATVTPLRVLSSLIAAFGYFIANMAIVTTAISLAIGESPLDSFRSNLRPRVIQQGALLGFTPVATAAIHDSIVLFPLLLIPIIVVYHSGSLTQRHVQTAQQLSELYETTRLTNARVGTRDSVHELLKRVCTMFNAQGASIVFFAREGEVSPYETSIDLDKDTFRYMQPTVLDPTKGIWARAASESRALRLASPVANTNLKAHYDSLGVKDVMVAPMMAEESATGIIRVWNRRGDDSQTFTSEDLRLFETVANHASIAMENARLITQLEDSLAHLTEMNQLKDDFVASVSHELRTPLTSIRGYVKTLLRPDADFDKADTKSFLETIDRQSNRLHRLIEDLLAVSRIESESDTSTLTMLALRSLADEVADELRTKSADHTIETRVPDDLPLVHTDAAKVHQIVSNLVDNALKYAPAHTTITVSAAPSGSGITLSVSDEGPGVPEELRDQIFERFYQVDQSATRSVGGAGLGLYICRRMAEAIGGRVWLERSDEKGSVFSLWIPTSIPLTIRAGTDRLA